jgi:3,4-dihydroxy 2-butanone 4-phosphate synthase
MFTGHIRELGIIDSLDGEHVRVRAPKSAAAISSGGSVCVSGVRLTVQERGCGAFGATIAAETRRRSTFDALAAGDPVNVELPLLLVAAGKPARPSRAEEASGGRPGRDGR